ncbi:MAG: hypothetical protein QXO37_09420 [Candidatus Nitrosocaldaceae archaeon]
MGIQVSKLTSAKLLRTFGREFRDGKTMSDKIRDMRRIDREARRIRKIAERAGMARSRRR